MRMLMGLLGSSTRSGIVRFGLERPVQYLLFLFDNNKE